MGKQAWNKFTTDHATAPAFTALVSSSLPKKAKTLDKAGKKLPTPYGLLVEWLKSNLSGDWTSMNKGRAVVVKVINPADAAVITTKFPPLAAATKTDVSAKTTQINYTDSNYGDVARSLGYMI